MTKQQTPLQELIEWYDSIPPEVAQKLFFAKATQLLEKEKENLGVSFIAGMDYANDQSKQNFEEFYQQTFIQ